MSSASSPQLRPMTAADLALVLRWRNHPFIRRYMYTTHEISPEEHQAWYAKASQDPARTLLIFEEPDLPLGYVQFCRSASMTDSALWGFYLGPNAPPGTGKQLGRAAVDYAFNVLQLAELRGEVLAGNDRSQRFHEQHGFHQVSPPPPQGEDGVRDSVTHYVLTRDVWRANRGLQND